MDDDLSLPRNRWFDRTFVAVLIVAAVLYAFKVGSRAFGITMMAACVVAAFADSNLKTVRQPGTLARLFKR